MSLVISRHLLLTVAESSLAVRMLATFALLLSILFSTSWYLNSLNSHDLQLSRLAPLTVTPATSTTLHAAQAFAAGDVSRPNYRKIPDPLTAANQYGSRRYEARHRQCAKRLYQT